MGSIPPIMAKEPQGMSRAPHRLGRSTDSPPTEVGMKEKYLEQRNRICFNEQYVLFDTKRQQRVSQYSFFKMFNK